MVIFGLLFLLILGILTFSSHSHLSATFNQESGGEEEMMPRDEPFKVPSNEPFRSSSPLLASSSSLDADLPAIADPSNFRLTGKEAFLKRQMLKNTSVTCNDGTTAGYYLRRNPGSKKWIIFLEGGGLCFSPLSCQQRWKVTRFFMTSAHWPQIKSSKLQQNHIILYPHFLPILWVGKPFPLLPKTSSWNFEVRNQMSKSIVKSSTFLLLSYFFLKCSFHCNNLFFFLSSLLIYPSFHLFFPFGFLTSSSDTDKERERQRRVKTNCP